MKTSVLLRLCAAAALFMYSAPEAHGQILKKLTKKAQNAAERTVERRVEQETSEKTDQVLDSILEPGQGKEAPDTPAPKDEGGAGNPGESQGPAAGTPAGDNTGKSSLEIYGKFDFVRGDEVVYFDDFANDFIGDFPAKWDTNGSGEVVAIGPGSEKWFELKGGSVYFPNISGLPEDYTIEMDIITQGLDRNTSSTAKLSISLEENNSYDYYKAGKNAVNLKVPYCQYADVDIAIWNKIGGESLISNQVDVDIRKTVMEKHHISIGVNGQRLRLWINETKYVDVPKLVAPGGVLNYLRLEAEGLREGQDRLFVKNVLIAKGGVDLRRKLLTEGSVSTNGILFDSGSANLQPQSMGIIRQISQVLQQEAGMKLRIVGHTDSDGDTTANQRLSEARAQAVKDALAEVYGIDASRLLAEGKGESEPVSDNGTPEGKAKNRRVVFTKI